jgi:hypothetical protein
MGYPGDDGGPPDPRAGTPRRTAVWDDDPGPEWPAQEPARPGGHRAAPSPPASPTYPNASTGQPPRPPQPGGATSPGSPERGRASHRRAPGPGPIADSRPPSGADQPRGRHGGAGRGRGAAQPAPPPPAHEDAWRRPPPRVGGDEIQGGTRQPGRSGTGSQTGGSLWSSGAFRTAGPGGRGPVRGYPPAPGAPDPVYPPGQFSPWNSPELRTAAGRPGHSAGLGPDPDEPGYSQLAVSDPAADATATQTWAVLDDAALDGEWTSPPARPSQAGPGMGPAGSGTGPAGTGPGPAAPGARGPFDTADPAAASAPWLAGRPGEAPPSGLTGAAGPSLAGGPAQSGPGYPGAPGAPRPGGRVAARRGRETALDAAQDAQLGTSNDARSRDTGGFARDSYGAGGIGTADPGSRDTGGFSTGGFSTGGFGTGGFGTADTDRGDPGGFGTGGFGTADTDRGDPGGFGTGGFDTGGFGTGGFGAPAERDSWGSRDTGPAGTPRGSRSAARGRTARQPRKPVSRVKMWMLPVVMLVLVGALITVVYLQFGPRSPGTGNAASAGRHPAAAASAASAVPPGPWKHITTRPDDPMALTLAELFPAQFSSGSTTAVRTVQKASGANCAKMVLGGKLQAALRKGGCTQVMRASYLSTGQKIMATIGVLNLANVTDSEQAGKATGATAFIKQLPGAKGPTRNLMKGTGLEEAEIKGHYLILTWAEFTSLKAPAGPKQRAQLDAFSRALVGSTANVSLTSRELLGKPATP